MKSTEFQNVGYMLMIWLTDCKAELDKEDFNFNISDSLYVNYLAHFFWACSVIVSMWLCVHR